MFVYADVISIRILHVRALLAARGPLIERRKSSTQQSSLPCTDLFHQVANAYANLSELDKSATLGIGARSSRRAAGQ